MMSQLTTLPRDTDGRLTPAPPPGELIDMPRFPINARHELANTDQRNNLQAATATIRAKRALRVSEVPQWEDLRQAAKTIKDQVDRHLDSYLLQAEQSLTKAGAIVHWARDATEANQIVVDLVKATGAPEVVKVKSMVTQETELNEALEQAGIAAWETDLAELIVQLGHDRPSHVLVPAIHKNRSQIKDIFLTEMGQYGTPAPADLTDDPSALTSAARTHLRNKFMRSTVGISGGNFLVADTGTLVVVESEGNGRMCLTLPQTLISVVGIEKIVPRFEDLEVFMRLLPRSSTGERMNPYTSMWTGVTPGDGPQNVHVVLVDNGRTSVLADPIGRQTLRCIRCSACMNTCPVYTLVGGHAYGSVYPGPIGICLSPLMRGLDSPIDQSLPYACTLCGACPDVCPVKIDFPEVIIHLRHEVAEHKIRDTKPHLETTAIAAAGWFFAKGRRFTVMTWLSGLVGRVFKAKKQFGAHMPWPARLWTSARDLPIPAAESFREWWRRNHERP
ncbi:MAG: iron-sulfur cluster-binding protein [Propionibacteriaceae bacterium]|jgi:L-lactate dehydrogenase complex protein LldF|nr:iron-sulfur cluster-binding protein [Propionibacteriaceae bacterium]